MSTNCFDPARYGCRTSPQSLDRFGSACRARVALPLLFFVIAAGLGCQVDPAVDRSETEEVVRPNVVLISLDTFRADRLNRAPFLSELAEKGWKSTRVWSSSNWTLPSHMSLLTSSNPIEHDRPRAGAPSPPIGETVPGFQTTLAEAFQSAGYFTAASTDGGYMGPGFDFERGFDLFRWEQLGSSEDALQRHRTALSQFMDERGEEPFFIFIHSYEIHDYFLNTPLYHLFVDEEKDREYIEHGSWLEEIRDGTAPAEYVSRLYDAGVRWADSLVRQIVSDIEARAPGQPLLVVVTSDHGESFGEKPGLWSHGRGFWEEQLRIPLVAWGNYESSPKGRNDLPVSLIDVAPSLLTVSGIEVPASFRGRPDVFEPLDGSGSWDEEKGPITLQASRVHTGSDQTDSYFDHALIQSGWKYSRRDSLNGGTLDETCFHLLSDPKERHDKMSDPSAPCSALAESLALKFLDSPARALHVTADSEALVELRFDDPESVVGVRTAFGAKSPIAATEEGLLRWNPRHRGDRLMVLLHHDPQGEVRISLAGVAASGGLDWSSLGSEQAPVEVEAGSHRVSVFRREARSEGSTEVREEEDILQQLKALGYVE